MAATVASCSDMMAHSETSVSEENAWRAEPRPDGGRRSKPHALSISTAGAAVPSTGQDWKRLALIALMAVLRGLRGAPAFDR